MQSLIITSHGAYVGKESERVVVRKGDQVLQEVPFFRLGEIVLPAHGKEVQQVLNCKETTHAQISKDAHA